MKINGKILVGDVRERIRSINKESVQMIVTSPPYWRLRDYGDEEDGESDKQLGLEATPEEFTQNLVEVFKECKRVLRPDGTLWLNIGDCYKSSGYTGGIYDTSSVSTKGMKRYLKGKKHPTIKAGELVGIPWMVAQALSRDGWFLRCPIIWHKTSSMPTSVKNRPGLNHEYIFLMSKSKQYYYDPYAMKSPTGNMLRSVWKMGTTKEKNIKHFATFPVELPLRCIKLGSSEGGCCHKCKTPYVRDLKISKKDVEVDKKALLKKKQDRGILGGDDCGLKKPPIYRETIGWKQDCDCKKALSIPCRVMDPFMGCFDSMTEVLTDNGWKLFDNLLDEDKICSISPRTDEIEFVGFNRRISYQYEGKMYRINGRSIDLLVTPNHMIWAKEYHQTNFSLHRMDEFEYASFYKQNQGICTNSTAIDKHWLELLGFWLGDGYRTKHRICFNLKKQRKEEYIRYLLSKFNIEWKEYNRPDGAKSFRINITNMLRNPELRAILKYMKGKSLTKEIPKFLFNLSSRSIRNFINGYRNADGDKNCIWSSNKKMVDDLQALLLLSGNSGIVIEGDQKPLVRIDNRIIRSDNPCYTLTTHMKGNKLLRAWRNVSVEWYSGMVYDVTLNKNHILYVRRNGKPCWSGNSGTTAVAAEKLKRRWVGVELFPKNRDIAINRIKSFIVGADYMPVEKIAARKKVGFRLSRRC